MHDDAVHLVGPGVDHAARALADDQVGEVAEGVGDAVDVDPALLQGLARVAALQQADLLAVTDQQVGDAAQQGGALGDRGAGPGALVEGAAGGGDGGVRVLGAALGDHRERLGVRRVDDLPDGPRRGRAPRSVHVNGLFCRHVVFAFRSKGCAAACLHGSPVHLPMGVESMPCGGGIVGWLTGAV